MFQLPAVVQLSSAPPPSHVLLAAQPDRPAPSTSAAMPMARTHRPALLVPPEGPAC